MNSGALSLKTLIISIIERPEAVGIIQQRISILLTVTSLKLCHLICANPTTDRGPNRGLASGLPTWLRQWLIYSQIRRNARLFFIQQMMLTLNSAEMGTIS